MRLDESYANGPFIPDAAAYPDRWGQAALAFRAALTARGRAWLDQPYGPGARHLYDLFLPEGFALGVVIFLHGGYWRAFDKSQWSHLAAGPLARGWAVAVPSYTLAPDARIGEITAEVAQALVAVAEAVDGPIVLTGHSAGGHLAARMLCPDVALPGPVAMRLARCVPISPLADLRPLLETSMNGDLRLDGAEACIESPALHPQARNMPVTVWVGAQERPAFLDQARWLAEAWPGTALRIAAGQHHFDVIDGLQQSDSPLCRAVLGA